MPDGSIVQIRIQAWYTWNVGGNSQDRETELQNQRAIEATQLIPVAMQRLNDGYNYPSGDGYDMKVWSVEQPEHTLLKPALVKMPDKDLPFLF